MDKKRTLVGVLSVGIALTLGLAACGGSGTSTEDGATTAAESATPAADSTTADTGASASTGSAAAVDLEGKRVAFFDIVKANNHVQANLRGVKNAVESAGVAMDEFDSAFDADTQISQIQDAVTSGKYDAFVIQPVGSQIVPAVREAVEAGIDVAISLTPLGDPAEPTSLVAGEIIATNQSYLQRGEAIGEAIVGACAGLDPCKAAIIYGVPAFPAEKVQYEAAQRVTDAAGNIDIVAVLPANAYDRAAGKTVAQDLLEANPDLNVIATVGDQMAAGAEDAAKAAGRDIRITGLGGSIFGADAIKAGRWYGSVVTLPETEGRLVGEALLASLAGGEVANPLPDVIGMSPVGAVVTQETIDQFQPEWEG